MSGPDGGWKTLCIKIGYSESTRAESREKYSTLLEFSGVFLGEVILDSDWLTKFWTFCGRFWLTADNFFGMGAKFDIV